MRLKANKHCYVVACLVLALSMCLVLGGCTGPASSPSVEAPSVAAFEVSSLTVTPDEVAAGEPVTIEAEIINTSQDDGVFVAALNIDGEQEAVKEKMLVDRFVREVVSNGLATYGEKQVREAIISHQAEKVLLSEDLEYNSAGYKCPSCGNTGRKIFREEAEARIECPKCKAEMRLESEKPLIDDLEELARENNIEVEIISNNTTEGMQFLTGFGGIGAMLRYKTR